MKNYRNRFVGLLLILFAVVLFLTFSAIAASHYRSTMQELQHLLEQELMPPSAAPPRRAVPQFEEGGPESSLVGPVVTVFQSRQTGEILALSGKQAVNDDGTVAAIVERIRNAPGEYGLLRPERIVYRRVLTQDVLIAAYTADDYLRTSMRSIIKSLVLIFIVSMAVLFPVSRMLARVAAKPLADAFARERQFTSDISHDLKTPLTVIMAGESMMRQEPDAPVRDQIKHLDHIRDAAESMNALLSQNLELTRVETVRRTVEKAPTDVSLLLERMCLPVEAFAYDKDVSFEYSIAPGVSGNSNEAYLSRIVSCLLENAVKYEPEGGAVTVTLTAERHTAVLVVENRLSRISKEDLPHIFERYYRGDKSRRESDGFGLGLAVSQSMVYALGGSIRAESDDSGTRFTVRLPLND